MGCQYDLKMAIFSPNWRILTAFWAIAAILDVPIDHMMTLYGSDQLGRQNWVETGIPSRLALYSRQRLGDKSFSLLLFVAVCRHPPFFFWREFQN